MTTPSLPSTSDPTGGNMPPLSPAHQDLKTRIHRRLLESMDLSEARRMPMEQLLTECTRRVETLLAEERVLLAAPERKRLLRDVLDEMFGLGPLEEYLRDPAVSDILVNGSGQVYLEREGRLH